MAASEMSPKAEAGAGREPARAQPKFIMALSAPTAPGIVAAVTASLYDATGNIVEAHHFDDPKTRRFFSRVVFTLREPERFDWLRSRIEATADRFQMTWRLNTDEPRRVMLLVSKFDHCLVDLLYRWRIGELPMIPTAIVSNHSIDHFRRGDFDDIPFHHLPVTKDNKRAQEDAIWDLVKETRTDLVVLARYMQVLSDDFSAKLSGRCINIHHSFLPGFKGAKPYHQAHLRGVKLIGATAHYVTTDLDEGPIIEQDIERISHNNTAEELVEKGRDIERRVLARAVSYHLTDRVLLNDKTTVVFSG